MAQPSNFIIQVFKKDRTIKISTISPNGKFFYKIKEPKDLYWGLFCSPIAFFDIQGNLLYYKKGRFAQFGLKRTKEWEAISWSSSGNFAFFIERNSPKSLRYILLDLVNKTVAETDFKDIGKDGWTIELFSKLPQDKAQEAYFKINAATSSTEAIDYVLSLNLVSDKRQLIKLLEQYFNNDFKKTLRQFEEGGFDESVILGSEFDDFTPIIPDKLQISFSEFFGINNWRP
jgi:hypothetical protein